MMKGQTGDIRVNGRQPDILYKLCGIQVGPEKNYDQNLGSTDTNFEK